MTTKYFFFFSGIFNNEYECSFTVDGIKYCSMIHYLSHKRALHFKDLDTAKKIINEKKSAIRQEALALQVAGFDIEQWKPVQCEIVKKGLIAKFNQNQFLKDYLLKQKGSELVYANPNDHTWGIGQWKEDALSHKEVWGENLLGKLLTEICNELN